MLSIFKDTARALARVSILSVLVVVVKGPSDELACASVGYFLNLKLFLHLLFELKSQV